MQCEAGRQTADVSEQAKGINALPGLNVRTMTEADIPQVLAIEEATFSEPWTADGFRGALEPAYALNLVIEEDGQILGYCGLLQSFEEANITNVAVKADARRRGAGRTMLTALLHAARERGVTDVNLEVRVSNEPALRLYESLGFRRAGTRRRFYSRPTEDAYVCLLHMA